MKKKILIAGIVVMLLGANAFIIPNIFAQKTPENLEVDEDNGNKLIFDPLFDVDNISYSRSFYKSEIERKAKINYEHQYNNARPSKTMDERTKDYPLYFDREKNMVVLPNREMTDDELLTMCDFDYNINTLYEKNRPHPTEDMIKADEAEKRARNEVTLFYGADLDKFNIECSYNGDIGGEKGRYHYTVCFSPINEPYLAEEGTPYHVYFVDIDANTGETLDTDSYYSHRRSRWKATDSLSAKEKNEFIQKSRSAMKNIADLGKFSGQYISKQGNDTVVTSFDNGNEKYEVELSYPDMDNVGWEKIN